LLLSAHHSSRSAVRLASQSCVPVQVSVDTAAANYPVYDFDTRGYGEVILCRDTIVTSITYWQPPFRESFEYYARMYVTSVDSSGRPTNDHIYYVGPTLHGVDSDTLHPSPIVFTFDPPLVLPGAARYFFDVKADDGLSCISDFWLLADTTDRYVDGRGWETGKLCDPCCPGGPSSISPAFDLIFDIAFCDTHSTPTLQRTWGELKARYR
jgi:hypothetical protein